MTEYADQSAGAIRLYLLRGDFDMSKFTILKHTSFTHGGVHINIGILGESHFVRLSQNGEVLSEICACTDAVFDDSSSLIVNDFLPNLHTVPVTAALGGREYSFTFSYQNWEHGTEELKILRTKMSNMHALSQKHIFPPHDSVHEEAVTEIYAVLKDDIHIYTVHTYPNEHVMVFTESSLSVGTAS